jgi:hypothetical protein
MKVALLIGVSDYSSPENNLLACKNDLELMTELVQKTGEYETILSIHANKPATTLKSEITDWFLSFKGKTVDEIFFYYTGHGELHGDEFYFQLHDFDEAKRNQTGLTNTELDSWLRSLSPSLTIKVIDACNSGKTYIKASLENPIKSYFVKSKSGFEKCIFMFSSEATQSSWQDDELSDFTRSFLQAVVCHTADKIRYRDIMDVISDDFENNPDQKPFFVIQANNTEEFCYISEQIKAIQFPQPKSNEEDLSPIKNEESNVSQLVITNQSSLKNIVERKAKEVVTEEKAIETLRKVLDKVNNHAFHEDVASLYTIEVKPLTTTIGISNIEEIAFWLENNSNKHEFFVESVYKTTYEEVEEYKTRFDILYGAVSPLEEMMGGLNPRVQEVQVLAGFKHSFDAPYHAIRILARPNSEYPNLHQYYCPFTFVMSKTLIRFYYYFTWFRFVSWKDVRVVNDVKWNLSEHKLLSSDSILDGISDVLTQFSDYIIKDIKLRMDIEV